MNWKIDHGEEWGQSPSVTHGAATDLVEPWITHLLENSLLECEEKFKNNSHFFNSNISYHTFVNTQATTPPRLLLRVLMGGIRVHVFATGSYFSTLFKLELPSLPPTTKMKFSIATAAWALLIFIIDVI